MMAFQAAWLFLITGISATGVLQVILSPEINATVFFNYCTNKEFTNQEFFPTDEGNCTLPHWDWALPLEVRVGRTMRYNLHFNTTPTDIDLLYVVTKPKSRVRLIRKTRVNMLISKTFNNITMVTSGGDKVNVSMRNICDKFYGGEECEIHCKPDPANHILCDENFKRYCETGYSGKNCHRKDACEERGVCRLGPQACRLDYENEIGFVCVKPDGRIDNNFDIHPDFIGRDEYGRATVGIDIDLSYLTQEGGNEDELKEKNRTI
uniref:Delta-like protein n=1 Tax=Caenorhabditis tropicalis TaxID=1561998 RepID=A0A1I7TNH5_9PELO